MNIVALIFILGPLILGLLGGLIAMLINRKTRVAGLVALLFVFVIAPLLIFVVSLFSVHTVRSLEQAKATAVMAADQMKAAQQMARQAQAEHFEAVQEITASRSMNNTTAEASPQSDVPETKEATATDSTSPSTTSPAGTMLAEARPQPAAEEVKKPLSILAPPGARERPAWVDAQPVMIDDTYRACVTVTPFTTQLERNTEVPMAVQTALDQYVRLKLPPEAAGTVQLPWDELSTCIKDQWQVIEDHSGEPMTRLYLLVAFDGKIKSRIDQQWTRVRDENMQADIFQRLRLTGLILAAVLFFLAMLFAILKITSSRQHNDLDIAGKTANKTGGNASEQYDQVPQTNPPVASLSHAMVSVKRIGFAQWGLTLTFLGFATAILMLVIPWRIMNPWIDIRGMNISALLVSLVGGVLGVIDIKTRQGKAAAALGFITALAILLVTS